ncbi:MAG: transcriptional regulator [Lachnospiraceae bacterium]|nr:transcriptional regulator [Lachnospiraceae bacterium]
MENLTFTTLKQLARGLAEQFGSNCEIVIHDLSKEHIDNSIVHIENGQVTGRKLGGSPSNIVIEALQKNPNELKDQYAYLTRTDNGRILKSTTIYIRGNDDRPRYVFAINYDITNLLALESTIKSITATGDDVNADQPTPIPMDVNQLLDELIAQSVELVGVPVAYMTKEDKIKAIQFLNDSGAFLITKSGDKVSKFFGISKYTLYSYVNINK